MAVKNGVHPSMGAFCFFELFRNSAALISAPELPATTLSTGCYEGMFRNCERLKNAPELPATTLAASCYREMFRDCTSLISVPELPAETLVGTCYYQMFYGCTNIKVSATQTGIYTKAFTLGSGGGSADPYEDSDPAVSGCRW